MNSRGDTYKLGPLSESFDRLWADWHGAAATTRLWNRDTSLWSSGDEGDWLDWLDAVATHRDVVPEINALVEAICKEGLTDVVLLGMGGSSLGPEVVAETFGTVDGFPSLHVLDSTVPDQVRRFRNKVDLKKTLVIVASKSGSTVEPDVLLDYFIGEIEAEVGSGGSHVVAVTDPGSSLEQRAKDQGFRKVFHGVPQIGGRFSALSCFGLLPAALAGVDLTTYLDRAQKMVDACKEADQNPGVKLGVAMGTAWSEGRDKLTLMVSPGLWDIGAWIEQLVAESTGKTGIGICPVDQEPGRPEDTYGNDRLFVYLRLASGVDSDQDERVRRLVAAGQPVVTLTLDDAYDLGAEFYRWEFATAVVGSLMRINPFNQPNVQESKDITAALLAKVESGEGLVEPDPAGEVGGLVVTTSAGHRSAAEAIEQIFADLIPGDYFTISAFCDRTEQTDQTFRRIRKAVGEKKGVATTLGYGPRFLHSTGQLHKGGTNRGVFVQITTAPDEDLPIPGKAATFGVLSRAQALGDFQALIEKGRRTIRIDLRDGLGSGLPELESLLSSAL